MGYGGRSALVGSLQTLKTHVNFIWNLNNALKETFMEASGESIVDILLLPSSAKGFMVWQRGIDDGH